jgi:menaquinone-9 beta-reductase
MSFDVIIVGAGPGGLACAEITAANGLKTLVLERKQIIGTKVCAGGVTWNGLVKKVPSEIFERQFNVQHVITRSQKVTVSAATPIIATVNRENLGQQMSRQAQRAGAEIRPGCQVRSITGNVVTFYDVISKKVEQQKFSCLVGADGSSSLVRRHLGIPVQDIGVGINYQLPGNFSNMEWHLDTDLFASGYAWVFPHQDSVSVGAYVDCRVMKAKKLHDSLIKWSVKSGHSLSGHKSEAELINFDFRGYHFNNIFLVGDAAGLASGLTGEGIYPAIVSGEAVAGQIVNPDFKSAALQKMIINNARHRKMVTLLGKNKILATLLAEMLALCFKLRVIKFSAAEMAH